MNINRRIEELQEELELLKDIQHNAGMEGVAKEFNKELKERATEAELKFKEIAKLKKLNLRFQYKINIIAKRRIKRFYFADFCDTKNKLIFEVDGEYHNTEEQQKKDKRRTKDFCKLGYKIFRISNEDVLSGKTTMFLINAYKSIGISI